MKINRCNVHTIYLFYFFFHLDLACSLYSPVFKVVVNKMFAIMCTRLARAWLKEVHSHTQASKQARNACPYIPTRSCCCQCQPSDNMLSTYFSRIRTSNIMILLPMLPKELFSCNSLTRLIHISPIEILDQ